MTPITLATTHIPHDGDIKPALTNQWRWFWGFGTHPERYEATCETRDEAAAEALAAAQDEGHDKVTVCEGRRFELSDNIFFADRVLEDWHEHNEEGQDEDGELQMQPSAAQQLELQNALAETLKVWRARHNLGLAWAIADTRNEEVIDVLVALAAVQP